MNSPTTITRRNFLQLAALAPLATLHAVDVKPAERPNIVFIITDQQKPSAMSCTGNPDVNTPNMDRLAARGVRFTKSYATFPLCCPSRASLFTSRMPHEMGIFENGPSAELSQKGLPTMGELFQAAGYRTAYAGKWHASMPLPAVSRKPEDRKIIGFETLPIPGDVDKKYPKHQPPPDVTPGLYSDQNIAEAAAQFIAQPHAKPFLLVVSIFNPHDICYVSRPDNAQKLKHLLPEDRSKLPPLPPNHKDTDALPTSIEHFAKGRSKWTEQEWREHLWIYYRLTERSDVAIGRVLAALDKAGLTDCTLRVFTADHGDMNSAHGLVSKGFLYENSGGVPLIVSPPGGQAKVDKEHLVSGLDVMPTLLDYAGIPAPASLLGRSLKPVVEGQPVAWREFVPAEASGHWSPDSRMIRTARYKYVVFASGANREQFFDMEEDPGELKNLIYEPALAAEIQRHRDLLKQWMLQTKDDAFGKDHDLPGKNKSSGTDKRANEE